MITIENFDKIRGADIYGIWYVKQESTQTLHYYLECEGVDGNNIPVGSRTFVINRVNHQIHEYGNALSTAPLYREDILTPKALIQKIQETFFMV